MTRRTWVVVIGGAAALGVGYWLWSRSEVGISGRIHVGGGPEGRPNRLIVNGSPLVPLNFGFDQDWIVDEADFRVLNAVALWLQAHPDIRVEVQGHTDLTGDETYNQRLSERRALNVCRYLIDTDVPADQLRFRGYGEEQPVSTTDDALNRRVEFMVM